MKVPGLVVISVVLFFPVGCGRSPEPAAGPAAAAPSGRTFVTLALNWYPEAEHGGYYAADELGLFDRENLDVRILPGSPGAARLALQELAAGRVDFAVSSADQVVEQRARGLPVTALLAPLQQSPRCIMVHRSSGIDSLESLASVELAVNETRPFALWMKKKLPLHHVTIVPFNGLIGEFLTRDDYAQQAYVFSEPFVAQEKGSDPVSLMLSDIGYNPYASVLVTSESMLRNHPETVGAMVRACRDGWTAWLKEPDRVNRRIHRENGDISLAALQYGASALKELCRTPPGQPFGSMTRQRWQQLIDQLEEVKIIEPGQVAADDCFVTLPAGHP